MRKAASRCRLTVKVLQHASWCRRRACVVLRPTTWLSKRYTPKKSDWALSCLKSMRR